MKRQIRRNRGFSLIELIVVMAVVAVLALLAVPRMFGYAQDARLTNIIHDIRVVEDKIQDYEDVDAGYTDEWATIPQEQLREYVRDRMVYRKGGLLQDYIVIRDDTYKKVPAMFLKRDAGVKLEGDFYLDEKGMVYYKDLKSAKMDSTYYYTCKLDDGNTMDVAEVVIDTEYEIPLQENEIMAGYRVENNDIMLFSLNEVTQEITAFLGKYDTSEQLIVPVENVVIPSFYRFIDGEYLMTDGLAALPLFGAFYFKDGIKFVSITTEGCNPVKIIPDEVIEEEEEEGNIPEEEPPKVEISVDNGIYSRGSIVVNGKIVKKDANVYSDYEGYLTEPVMPEIPTEDVTTLPSGSTIDQSTIDNLTTSNLVIDGDLIVSEELTISDEVNLFVTGNITILDNIKDDLGVTQLDRELSIFHYGDRIEITAKVFSGNVFIEEGTLIIDQNMKIQILGNIISGGDDINLDVNNNNIELLGSIYAPFASITIDANNLFIDRGSLIGFSVYLDGHFKIKDGGIGNDIE